MQLVSDSGTPFTAGSLPTIPALQALLQEASGMVESAACVQGRYLITPTQNDLQQIYTSNTNTAQTLIGLVCALAYFLIWDRRPEWLTNSPDQIPARVKLAMDMLDHIRDGEAVFGVLEIEEAGILSDVIESESQVLKRNGTVTVARALFGPRVMDMQG